MISDYNSLKAELLNWAGRGDLDGQAASFIAPVVADAAIHLNIFVTESFMTQLAVAGQSTIIVPSGYESILALYVNGIQYHRRTHREVVDKEIKNSFSPYGEEIWFYPPAENLQIIRMEFRGLQRDGGSGTGISSDNLGELFSRRVAVAGVTEGASDAYGRFPLLIDHIKKPIRDDEMLSTEDARVDNLSREYNAAERLIQRFPNVFLHGALENLYKFIQDEERATYWQKQYRAQIEAAQYHLMQMAFGGAPLAIQKRSRTLFQGRR